MPGRQGYGSAHPTCLPQTAHSLHLTSPRTGQASGTNIVQPEVDLEFPGGPAGRMYQGCLRPIKPGREKPRIESDEVPSLCRLLNGSRN